MSDPNLLSQVAELLRPVSLDVSKGYGKLCLSTIYLKKLNDAFDENVPEDLTSSFHLTDAKANLQRDLQFLFDLVKGTVALKITPDLIQTEESNLVNLKRFKNIKTLEIHKIDVKNILGIQRLRSQIQEISCVHNLTHLADILDKCGGDLSSPNLWSDLKRANFSHNQISSIDGSLESVAWLNTLNLSHNQLTNVEFINILPNLKYLNLSYNQLERVPRFKGQICKRLQVLLLNNNFIDDLLALSSLTDLSQLDLSQNCIMEHKSFTSISSMPSLYFLNLQGNPIQFHPLHRTLTCNYLNKNTSTLKFVLDNILLNKSEKQLTGSLYPMSQSSLGMNDSSSHSSLDNTSTLERQKKVRNVEIQDGYEVDVTIEKKKQTPVSSPRISSEHLEVKNKIEQLRQEFGKSWLIHQSGEKFQEVLGFEKNAVLSSTPNELNLSDRMGTEYKSVSPVPLATSITIGESTAVNNRTEKDIISTVHKSDSPVPLGTSITSVENTAVLIGTETPVLEVKKENKDMVIADEDFSGFDQADNSEDESLSEDDDGGEIFFASSVADSDDYDLSLIVTDTHLSERDSILSKEKARWHINIVKSCQQGDKPNEVQIVFDTFRSDRKSRTYYVEESEKFIKIVFERMIKNKIPDERIQYQCIKCNELFSRTKSKGVLVEVTVTCPKCESNLVIESK